MSKYMIKKLYIFLQEEFLINLGVKREMSLLTVFIRCELNYRETYR